MKDREAESETDEKTDGQGDRVTERDRDIQDISSQRDRQGGSQRPVHARLHTNIYVKRAFVLLHVCLHMSIYTESRIYNTMRD